MSQVYTVLRLNSHKIIHPALCKCVNNVYIRKPKMMLLVLNNTFYMVKSVHYYTVNKIIMYLLHISDLFS